MEISQELVSFIITENELNTTIEEFNLIFTSQVDDPIVFNSSIHSFSENYNGYIVENTSGQEDALYYILKIEGSDMIYLQYEQPAVEGHIAITAENVNQIIEDHKKMIENSINFNIRLKNTVSIIQNR